MKPIKKTIAAAAIGTWIPVARQSFGTAGFTVHPQTTTAGTYDIDFTESNIYKSTRSDFTRSTTTLTITSVAHGLTTADACIITGSRDFEGQYEIASVASADSITVTVADAGDTSGSLGFIPLVVDQITGFAAADATATASGNLFASVSAVRLNATSVTTAPIDFLLNQREG